MLQTLRDLWPWKPIKNCPGRYVVSKVGDGISPERVVETLLAKQRESQLGEDHMVRWRRFKRDSDHDDVFIAVFLDRTGGGLITFCKTKGVGESFVHTLNEPDGLVRKCKALGYEEVLSPSGESA
jgi:hypothetical protein